MTEFDYSRSSNIRDAVYEYLEALRLAKALPTDVVLDVGCGMNWLKTLGYNVIGVDLAENSRADIIADARMLPLRSKSVDVAISIEVIEHLPRKDAERMLAEMARVAKRFVVVSTVNRFAGRHDPRHVHEYTLIELVQLMKRFCVVSEWSCGGCGARLPRFLRYVLPPWLWSEWIAVAGRPR